MTQRNNKNIEKTIKKMTIVKFLPINNYFKYKCIKLSNQMTKNVWIDKKETNQTKWESTIYFPLTSAFRTQIDWK